MEIKIYKIQECHIKIINKMSSFSKIKSKKISKIMKKWYLEHSQFKK